MTYARDKLAVLLVEYTELEIEAAREIVAAVEAVRDEPISEGSDYATNAGGIRDLGGRVGMLETKAKHWNAEAQAQKEHGDKRAAALQEQVESLERERHRLDEALRREQDSRAWHQTKNEELSLEVEQASTLFQKAERERLHWKREYDALTKRVG